MGKFSTALEKAEQQTTEIETQGGEEEWLKPEKIEKIVPEPVALTADTINSPTNSPWNARLFKAINEDTSIPEIFKVLRSRILHPQNHTGPIKTVMVTSAVPKEGKSFTSANLAISLAQGLDQHSLLVDCDLRRPSLANLLGISATSGLVNHLRDNTPLPSLIMKTTIDKLSIIPSGRPPLNPSELLSSSKMKALSNELSQRYDDRIIILDSPPMMVAAESADLAGLVDAIILVVREGMSKKSEIQKSIDAIGKSKILGMVYNAQKSNIFDKTYSKKYNYYQYDS
ncbi:polysaccharide biosynthesis tyrosine autokinase [Desulforhopalus sp. 52FAK]